MLAIGIASGWSCLEVGAGIGTVSAWMAGVVGATGCVLSTDVDLRFHDEPVGPTEVRHHDVTRDPLPIGEFDLVHARAVLQHVAQREEAIGRLIDALKPGGWLVIEEADMRAFEAQPLPEPLGALHRLTCRASTMQEYRDPNFGTSLLRLFQDHGLVEVEAQGRSGTMRAGDDSGEWWFLAIEHVRDAPVDAAISARDFETGLRQARTPGFAMLGPLSIQARGRVAPRAAEVFD